MTNLAFGLSWQLHTATLRGMKSAARKITSILAMVVIGVFLGCSGASDSTSAPVIVSPLVGTWSGDAVWTLAGSSATIAIVEITITNVQNGAIIGTGKYNNLPGTGFQPSSAPISGTFTAPASVTVQIEEPRFRNKATISGELSSDRARIVGTLDDGTFMRYPITLRRR
jgi:hypothetical protein